MSNAIQLRRPVVPGDQVMITMNGRRRSSSLIYTVSRVEGVSLFGYRVDDPNFSEERWITRDYKNPRRRTFDDGKEIILHVKHVDGRHIQ